MKIISTKSIIAVLWLVALSGTWIDGKPTSFRRKRFIGYDDYRSNPEVAPSDYREYRSETTFPPFPGEDYFGSDPDWEATWSPEPETEPPRVIPTTTERSYESESRGDLDTATEKPFHRRVGSWFKNQWNHLKKHYNSLSNTVG